MLTGENGIINNAIQAKELNHVAEIKETIGLEIINIESQNIQEEKISFNERKQIIQEKLDSAKLLHDASQVENMIIVYKKYPLFLTSEKEPIELDKNLYDYQIIGNETAKITNYKGNEENVIIPSYVIDNGQIYIITTIDEKSFKNNSSIINV